MVPVSALFPGPSYKLVSQKCVPFPTPDLQAGCGSDSLYEGYAGAMRCLMEGIGDVAFVKQSTPLDYASDGGSRQAWSTLNQVCANASPLFLCACACLFYVVEVQG